MGSYYEDRIRHFAETIINEKRYDSLFSILKNYDKAIKTKDEYFEWPNGLPFWDMALKNNK